jgi:hypothetical protein
VNALDQNSEFDGGDLTVLAQHLTWVPIPLVPEGPLDRDERTRSVEWFKAGMKGVQP